MKNAVLSSLCLALVLSFPGSLQAQKNDLDLATEEGARRQAHKIELDRRLIDAQAAEKKGAFLESAQLYTDCLDLVRKIGSGVDTPHKQALDGFIAVRLQLAEQAYRARDFGAADDQYIRILREDPKNERVLQLRETNRAARAAAAGRMPSQAALDKLPEIYTNRVTAATLVQDGRMFYEQGRFDEAEARLKQALAMDPSNRAANYYVQLVIEQRYRNATERGEEQRRRDILKIEQAWAAPIRRELPVPNPMAATNLVYTGKGRQRIYGKLDNIHLGELSFDGIPL